MKKVEELSIREEEIRAKDDLLEAKENVINAKEIIELEKSDKNNFFMSKEEFDVKANALQKELVAKNAEINSKKIENSRLRDEIMKKDAVIKMLMKEKQDS